nr:MAG TPA: hypothetical protein [Caudoviricetes sp.]
MINFSLPLFGVLWLKSRYKTILVENKNPLKSILKG